MKRSSPRVVVLTVENDTVGADYIGSLHRAGFSRGEIVVVRASDPVPGEFDAVVLGGGEDVEPGRYGEMRHPKLGPVNRERDEQELALVLRARRQERPIFGICRGLQLINVAFNGTLVQDIPSQRPSDVPHNVPRPTAHLAHEVRIAGTSFLFPDPGAAIHVNSRHHQAVDRLGDGLRATARSEDGLIEAFEADGGGLVVAVQWHPENLSAGPAGQNLFVRFASAVKSGSGQSVSQPHRMG